MAWTSNDVYGLDTLVLPEGCRPLEAIVVVKCLTEEGNPVYLHRYTRTLSGPESLGMAQGMVLMLEEDIKASYIRCECEPYEDPDA